MCAANVSEGRDAGVLDALRAAAGAALLDVHVDVDHHRCVLTMAGTPSAAGRRRSAPLATVAIGAIDLTGHVGAHPRLGALDVVPFAPLPAESLDAAVAAREAAMRALAALGIPSFRYGPAPDGSTRSLPEVRRARLRRARARRRAAASRTRRPARPPSARAPPLVAWNLWLQGATLGEASRIAAVVRGPRSARSASR